MIFSSFGVDIPVIITKKMNEISISKDIIEVQTGVLTQKLSTEVAQNSLSGFEFLIGIPSTLGGAVAMNAGAHGQEISDCLLSALIYDKKTKSVVEFSKEQLKYSYRNSIIKQKPNNYVVLSAKFKLEKKSKDEILKKMDENTKFRKNNQPSLALPNVGSVFKNHIMPSGEKLSAGMLIDKCGLRGKCFGGAKVWENHANFAINFDNATSSDYLNVIFAMYNNVKEKFQIELEPEVVFVGKMSKVEEEQWKIMKKS